MTVKDVAKKAWADLIFAVKHPETARKVAAAVVASVLGDIAAFSWVLAHVPAPVAAGVSVVQAALVAASVFLTSNKVVEVTTDVQNKVA